MWGPVLWSTVLWRAEPAQCAAAIHSFTRVQRYFALPPPPPHPPPALPRPQDLATGAELGSPIPDTDGGMVWAADNKTLFYVVQDAMNRCVHVCRCMPVLGGRSS